MVSNFFEKNVPVLIVYPNVYPNVWVNQPFIGYLPLNVCLFILDLFQTFAIKLTGYFRFVLNDYYLSTNCLRFNLNVYCKIG